MSRPSTYEIRAAFDAQTIAVYAAFDAPIANVAIKGQRLLPPFHLDRMTWIKPSFLWLMYRSQWARRAGMSRILRICIDRKEWDAALAEAVLTTPEPHVYPDAKEWRKKLERARVRVQWDPERNIENERLPFKSIQVGLTPAITPAYAKKWIRRIEDQTELAHRISALIEKGEHAKAQSLLPEESPYPVAPGTRRALGMHEQSG